MIKPKNELSPKHLEALGLLRAGGLTEKDIAQKVGWSYDHIRQLVAGDTKSCGSSAFLFSEEVKRIRSERDKLTRETRDHTKALIFDQFEKFALGWKDKKAPKPVREEMRKIAEVLSKSTPNVEIGSFSYTKGLSAEDLVNEFKRLKGLGLDGRGVSPAFQGEPREIPRIEEPGSTA